MWTTLYIESIYIYVISWVSGQYLPILPTNTGNKLFIMYIVLERAKHKINTCL